MSSSSPSISEVIWEGDHMFNVYVHDYCMKRGFNRTADALKEDAELGDIVPPIQTKQGFIFEWWSVFWVTFNAKTRGESAADEALLYVQHIEQKTEPAHLQPTPLARPPPPPGPLLPNMPSIPRPGPVTNGAPPHRPPYAMPNGHMSNGIPHPGPNPMQAQQPGFPGNPQPNGVPHGPVPPHPGAPTFPPMPGQRAIPPPPQQRVNGAHSYQGSPAMAHSPPQGGPGQHPPQPGMHAPPHPSPMVGHVPAPHMRGQMPPPNGMPAQHPSPSYSGARPPSRQTTPSGMLPQASPSMRSAQLMPGDPRQQHEQAVIHELQRVPPEILNSIKAELGIGNREVTALTLEERQRLLQTVRQRFARPGPQHKPGLPNNMPPPQQPVNPTRGNKRASSSPGDEDRHDGSPPNAKRQKPSPPESGPMTSGSYPPPPQQHGGHPNAHMQGGPSRMLPPGVPPGTPMYSNPGMMHMGGGHIPPTMPMPPQSQPMGPPMTPQQYRNSMHAAHQGRMPIPPQPMPAPSAPGDFAPGPAPGSYTRGVPTKMPPPPSPAMATKDVQKTKEAKSAETSPGTAPATPAPAPSASAPPTMEMGVQGGARPPSQGGVPPQSGAQPAQAPSVPPPAQQQQQPASSQQPAPAGQVNGFGADGLLDGQSNFMDLFPDGSFGSGLGDMSMSSGDLLGYDEQFGNWFGDSDRLGGMSGVDVK